MKIVLTCMALICFAANSLICRAALRSGAIDATSFTFIRISTGAFFLLLLLLIKQKGKLVSKLDWPSSLALMGYAILFSFSYLQIDAGIGALLLFGSVQVTMITWGFVKRIGSTSLELWGLLLALIGLILLTVPGKEAPKLEGSVLMILAGVSWGIYSLRGRSTKYPLGTTAWNFILATPIAFLIVLIKVKELHFTSQGILLACISGIVTSGFGYTIWYAVLPSLRPSRAAVIQLSVPILAMAAAVPLLGEKPQLISILAGVLTLSGVAVAISGRRNKKVS